jgi:hypothetical protein
MIRARRAFNATRYQEAYDEAVQGSVIPGAAGMFLGVALHAAAWGRLTESVPDLVERSDRELVARALDGEQRAAAHALQDVLEGRVDAGVATYRRAVASLQENGARLLAAQLSLDIVVLLGPDHPASREALALARPIYESLNAEAWVERALAAAAAPHVASSRVTT